MEGSKMTGKKRVLLGVFLAFALILGAMGQAVGSEQDRYVVSSDLGMEDFLVQTTDARCDRIEPLLDCTTVGRAVDIVFVFDTTGSMGGEINAMKTAAINFADALAASGIDYRLGLTEYKDFPKSPCGGTSDFPYKVYNGGNLTSSKTTFQGWISGLRASGGADWPESLLAALSHTVSDQKWRGGSARKIAIVITDAPPHDDGHSCNAEGNRLANVISKLVSNGIVTHVVSDSTYSANKQIASATGGSFFPIRGTSDFSDIIDTIADIISCSFDVKLAATCVGGKLTVKAQLIGVRGTILPHSGYSDLYTVKATATKSGGGSVNVPMSYNSSTKMWEGSVSGASGSYKVGVTAKVCDWSSSASVTVRCDGDGVADCEDCPDSDNDGVIDAWDLCPATPPCSGVDRHGCRVCESRECIKIIKPASGEKITTTLTLAATACPTPAAVKFIIQWPDPFSGATNSVDWTDTNAADGWGVFNIPITPIVLAPVNIKAQALGTGGRVICESGWVTFSFSTL
jgi:hypothetical protein